MNTNSQSTLPESLESIETLMLDMDGTLLDLAYDNYMWLEHIPRHYAQRHGIAHDEARDMLVTKFAQASGDLRWYCLDHWSEDLGLDVVQLHHDVSHRIGYLPGARKFLQRVQQHDVRVLLVTNSHRTTYELKDAITGLSDFFDGVHSSHDYGYAKETPNFWEALQAEVDFDPAATLFVDDSRPVLRSARQYGIGSLVRITQPDSRMSPDVDAEFAGVSGVAELPTG